MLILLAEADLSVSRPIRDCLKSDGHRIELVTDGVSAIAACHRTTPDLLMVAWQLPAMSGLEVCRELRTWSELPIMFVGAADDRGASVAALDAGADDYLVAPIQLRELVARVRALARRTRPSRQAEVLSVGDLRVYPREFRVTLGDLDLPLRPQEYRLLLILARQPNVVFSTERLKQLAWSRDVDSGTVGVHLTWLRRKLRGSDVRLENVRGRGFRLVAQASA